MMVVRSDILGPEIMSITKKISECRCRIYRVGCFKESIYSAVFNLLSGKVDGVRGSRIVDTVVTTDEQGRMFYDFKLWNAAWPIVNPGSPIPTVDLGMGELKPKDNAIADVKALAELCQEVKANEENCSIYMKDIVVAMGDLGRVRIESYAKNATLTLITETTVEEPPLTESNQLEPDDFIVR